MRADLHAVSAQIATLVQEKDKAIAANSILSTENNDLVKVIDRLKQERKCLVRHIVTHGSNYEDMDALGRIRYLRDFVMQNIPHSQDLNKGGLPEGCMLTRSLEKKIGYLCGRTSQILAWIYNIFDFEATFASFGYRNTPDTHTVTLVRHPDVANNGILIMDPLYGHEFIKDNKPISLSNIINAIKDEKYIIYDSCPVEVKNPRPYLVKKAQDDIEVSPEYFPEWTIGAYNCFLENIKNRTGITSSYQWLELLLWIDENENNYKLVDDIRRIYNNISHE